MKNEQAVKKVHLLRYLRRSSLRRTAKSTPHSSLLDALYLELFEQPEETRGFFNRL